MHFLIDYTKKIIPSNWSQTQNNWYSGNCPVCIHRGQSRPDTKHRGGFVFEHDRFGYNCFNCHFKARWEPGTRMTAPLKFLLECFGADELEIHRLTIDLMREDTAEELLLTTRARQTQSTHVFIPQWDEIKLPNRVTLLSAPERQTELWEHVYNYAVNRNLDPTKLLYSPLAIPSLLNQRFIIPYFYKGKLVGFNARITTEYNAEKVTKYFKQCPSDFVFNLDNQKSSQKYVIVTEGEIDALMVNGVSVGHNEVSDNQAYLINRLGKQVILVPDMNKTGKPLIRAALAHNWMVSFPPWHRDVKDINDAVCKYGRVFVMKTILDFATANKTKITVMMNKTCK
jgi:hypothetical protein